MPAQRRPGLDEQTLETIRGYIDEHGYPPTVRELGELLGLTSTATVVRRIEQLTKDGLITHIPTKPRTIRIVGMKTEPETM